MSKYAGVILVAILLIGVIGIFTYRGMNPKPVLLSEKYVTGAEFIRYLDKVTEVFEPETYEENTFKVVGISEKEYIITQKSQKDRSKEDVIDICMGVLKSKKIVNYDEDIDYANKVLAEFPIRKLQNLHRKLTNEIVFIEEIEDEQS